VKGLDMSSSEPASPPRRQGELLSPIVKARRVFVVLLAAIVVYLVKRYGMRSAETAPAPTWERAEEPSVPAETVVAELPTWVEATGGACPTSHPVKAKAGSEIFHLPGGASYDRTKADRCYLDAAAAQADGLRAAKR